MSCLSSLLETNFLHQSGFMYHSIFVYFTRHVETIRWRLSYSRICSWYIKMLSLFAHINSLCFRTFVSDWKKNISEWVFQKKNDLQSWLFWGSAKSGIYLLEGKHNNPILFFNKNSVDSATLQKYLRFISTWKTWKNTWNLFYKTPLGHASEVYEDWQLCFQYFFLRYLFICFKFSFDVLVTIWLF